jgi:hypothetical protein
MHALERHNHVEPEHHDLDKHAHHRLGRVALASRFVVADSLDGVPQEEDHADPPAHPMKQLVRELWRRTPPVDDCVQGVHGEQTRVVVFSAGSATTM